MRPVETSDGTDDGGLLPLFVPVPEDLAELLGYEGQARHVAFFWSDEANAVVVTDGAGRHAGESLRFLEYAGHPHVERELGDLNIGLFDRPATVWLVLDRETGNLYYAPAGDAQRFLTRQHPGSQHSLTDCCISLSAQYAELLDQQDPECERMLDELDRWMD